MGTTGNMLMAGGMRPPLPPEESSVHVVSSGERPQQTTAFATLERTQEELDAVRKKELLDQAHERFHLCIQNESQWRQAAVKEWNFALGLEHWTEELKQARKNKPCLTFDRIGPAMDQVKNAVRQEPPEAKFYAVEEGDQDKELAEVVQGLVRGIEEDSTASTAYESAFEPAVEVGWGWWRYTTEFEKGSFKQKIVVKEIHNPLSVYRDPAAVQYDCRDGRFLFFTEDFDADAFRAENPGSMAGLDFEGIGDQVRAEWFPNGAIRVAEYWYAEEEEETIVKLSNGMEMPLIEAPAGVIVINRRTEMKRVIRGARISGREILAEWEWLGEFIPFVPVRGKRVVKDGKRSERGMIRPAMDANLSYDVLRSRQVEVVGVGTVAPWMMAAGQDEGFEHEWQHANTSAQVLHYNTEDKQGRPVGPPQRVHATVDISGITAAVGFAENDVKATTQEYDASLGSPGPESSGRAILARQKQGDNAHFNYRDNLARSLRFGAEILLDLIPKIYDEDRLVKIVDKDQVASRVRINAPFEQKGKAKLFSIADVREKLAIGVGPSYQTRMQEASAAWPQLAQSMPIIAERAPDLIVRSTGLPYADEIAERVQPPDTKQQDGADLPPQYQQLFQQQATMIQALTDRMNELSSGQETEMRKIAADLYKETIRAETQIAISDRRIGSEESKMVLSQFLQQLNQMQEQIQQMLNPQQPQETEAVAA